MKRLAGVSAIVTGAAGGIGRGIVRRYLDEGAHVLAADLDEERLAQLRAEFGSSLETLAVDVSCISDNRRMVEKALSSFGKLDVFCANAGIYDQNTALETLSCEQISQSFDEIFSVNVKSVLLAARAAFEALLASNGTLIVTASFASMSPSGGGALYTASKHAVAGLVKQLAYEFAPDVRVNGVAPGIAPTRLRGLSALGQQPQDSVLEGVEKIIPLQTVPDADSYGGLYALLASREDAAHITGSIFSADSGLAIRGMTSPGGRTVRSLS